MKHFLSGSLQLETSKMFLYKISSIRAEAAAARRQKHYRYIEARATAEEKNANLE